MILIITMIRVIPGHSTTESGYYTLATAGQFKLLVTPRRGRRQIMSHGMM